MRADVELSPDDIQGLLFSVLEYNGYKPTGIAWTDAGGQAVSSPTVRITCENPGLRVRVAPEGTTMEERLRAYTSLLTKITGE